MDKHFNKTSAVTPKTVAAMAIAAAITAGSVDTANSEEAIDESDEDAEVRFQATVEPPEPRLPLTVSVFRPDDEQRGIWHVAVGLESPLEEPLCLTTLPLEAGEEFYEYELRDVSAQPQGDHRIALLDVSPTGDEAPLDPPAYQLAFFLDPEDSRGWRCSLVGRGEQTELDGGPRLDIETIDDQPRLVRTDPRQQVDFCGRSVDEHDDLDVFDSDTGRFLPASPVEIGAEDAESLDVEWPDETIVPPLTEGFYAWLAASSDVHGAPRGAAAPRPRRLGELDVTTAWVEGGDGLGIGEFVTAGLDDTASITGLRVFPGHGDSREAFDAYARPTRLLVGLEDGHRFVLDFSDYDYADIAPSEGFFVAFPEPIESNCLSVMILDAVAGQPPDPDAQRHQEVAESVAISEITPYSNFDADTEEQTARRLVDEIAGEPSPKRRDRIAAFGLLMPSAMTDSVSRILDEGDEAERQRVVPILGHTDPDVALPVLRSHFLGASVEQEDYRRTKRAIAAHGTTGAPVLIDLLGDLEIDDPKYIDAVRIIGRVGSDVHRQRLIAELGQGGEFLRRERVRAVANGGIGVVPGLISHANTHVDTDAAVDALSALVFVGQRHFQHHQADIEDADKLRDTYLQSTERSHRIRAIEALGYFPHPDGIDLLGDQILFDDPDPVVRSAAAAALQLYPQPQARRALQQALEDESPDVRIAAIRSLNRRDDAREATDAVIEFIATARWPAAQHHALLLLARSEKPQAVEAVADLIADDITSSVAATALRALRRAENPLSQSEIEGHLADAETPPSILEQLVHMIGLADFAEADDLLFAIANRNYEPLGDRPIDELDALARRAFLALGSLRTDAAREFLFDVVVDDERRITDRYHALHGLGFFPDPELLERLRDIAHDLPDDLRRRHQQTLSMIENRLAVDDAGDEVEQLIDELDDGFDDDFDEPLDEEPFDEHAPPR